MHWDDPGLILAPLTTDRTGGALILSTDATVPGAVASALVLAGFRLGFERDPDRALARIATEKPDLVLCVMADLGRDPRELAAQIDAARATETLPLLALTTDAVSCARMARLDPACTEAEAFLNIRALVRRERPASLRGTRQSGRFELDEGRFRISYDGRVGSLTKMALCLLGPFFDVPDAVFDRATLEKLAFGTRSWEEGARNIDAYVSRVRRAIRSQLGHDPIRSVRGIGYRLNHDPAPGL